MNPASTSVGGPPFRDGSRPRPVGLLRRSRRLLPGAFALLFWVAGAFGGEQPFTEYQVKALFLFNFTKYVDWPAHAFTDTNAPIIIGVYGENRFGDDLNKTIAGKTVGGRSITFRQIEKEEDLGKCHMLFISNSEKKRLSELLNLVKGLPVLTVGETDQFADQGGVINFAIKDGKVRLEINVEAAQQSNLRISSKLLGVATVVKGKTR